MADPGGAPTEPTPTAIVTGAASGIGLELAKRLAENGYRLVLVDLHAGRLAEAAAAVAESRADRHPSDDEWIVADVSRPEAWADLAGTLRHDRTDLALLANAAGVLAAGPLTDTSAETIHRVVGVNLTGVLLGCQAMAPLLFDSAERSKRTASIPVTTPLPRGVLNVASIFATVSPPRFAIYSATKAGVVSATEALRGELRNAGLTATVVLPGVTRTGLFAGGDYTDEAVRRVVQDQAAEATLSAAEIAEASLAAYRRKRATAVVGRKARRYAWLKRLLGDRLIDAVAARTNANFE